MPVPKNTGSHKMRRSPSAASASARAGSGRQRQSAAPNLLPLSARPAARSAIAAAPLALGAPHRSLHSAIGHTAVWLLVSAVTRRHGEQESFLLNFVFSVSPW